MEPTLSWELVKNLFKMYKKMEKREQMFHQYANADVTSMAVKPDKILDDIREFNSMFEGNMQHDAQELLRCLLCYLEDSERELHGDYARLWALDPSLLKTPVKQTPSRADSKKLVQSSSGKNRARRRVLALPSTQPENLAAGTSSVDPTCMRSACASTDKPDISHTGDTSSEKCHGADGRDILDDIDSESKETTKAAGPANHARSKKRKFQSEKAKRLAEEAVSKTVEVDGFVQASSAVDTLQGGSRRDGDGGETEDCGKCVEISGAKTRKSARRSGRLSADADESIACITSNTGDALSSTDSVSSKSSGQKTVNDLTYCSPCSENTQLSKNDRVEGKRDCAHTPKAVDKNQPTILSMFVKKNSQCRRLGMRGRAVCRDQNGGSSMSPETKDVAAEAHTVSPNAGRGTTVNVSAEISPTKGNCRAVNRSAAQNGGESSSWLKPDADSFLDLKLARNSLRATNSPVRRSPRKTAGASSSTVHCLDMNGLTACSLLTETCDQISLSGLSLDSHTSPGRTAHSTHHETDDDRLTPPASPSLSPAPSTVSKALSFSTQDPKCLSPQKMSKTASPAESNNTGIPLLGIMQPKLMIKLEKCDRLCSSPTVSASAAMKALQTSSNAVRKVTFNMEEDTGENDGISDTEEEEGILGKKASFQSVPLKSVSVKVEKCDMVCSSPEKSVSARFATSCLARQRAQRFNIIEKLFQGSMMMRTKCLECENCTERRESFQDVSVPLKEKGSSGSDSESDEEKSSCLLKLMQAFTEVERLQDENKYFCDHCVRKNEAERSLHYDILPNILTVHLKRFSATGMFGCLSKINDHVTVPLLLSCLRYKCPKPCVRPDHRYTLFAIITHAGSTISAGHYLSYIKVRPNADGSPLGYDTLVTYLNSSPEKRSQNMHSPVSKESPQTEGKMESECEKSDDHVVPSSSSFSGDSSGRKTRDSSEGKECVEGERTKVKNEGGKRSTKVRRGEGKYSTADSNPESISDSLDYHWLECDDETIHILSQKEFQLRLSEKEGALRGTPYVLFYHRLDKWRGK